jgi:microcystin-dependent protein
MTKKLNVASSVSLPNKTKPFLYSGAIVSMVSTSTPDGWLACDGTAVSQTTYPNLYAAIGNTYGNGTEGAGNFRLPNLVDALLIAKTNTSGVSSSGSHSHGSNATLSSASISFTTSGQNSAYHGHTTNFGTNNASFDHGHGYVDAGANGGTDNNPVNANKTGTATAGISGAGHYHSVGAVGNTGASNVDLSHTHGSPNNIASNTADYSHNHSGSASITANSNNSTFLPPSITARFYIKV